MRKDNYNIDEKIQPKFIESQTPKTIIKQIPPNKINGKESTMMSIKNMFNLNIENKSTKNNFNNSFYKISQDSNPEELPVSYDSLMPRTLSNHELKKDSHLNNKNFPSKKNVCKGTPNISNNYNNIPNSSPIFQYYASNQGNGENFLGGGQGLDLNSSLENGNSLGYIGGRDSPQSTGFNYSPSQIFNNNRNLGSGNMKVRSESNVGIPFSIDSGVDDEKLKNLDLNSPLDDLYTIEFDDENFEINFAEDKNAIVNKINERKKNKQNQNENINNNKNDEINKNMNNNDVYFDIDNNSTNQEKNLKNNDASSNLPIKKVMEKLRKKKIESESILNNKTKNISENNENKNLKFNNLSNKNYDSNGISNKSVESDRNDFNQNLSDDFKMKFVYDLDKIDDDHSFETKSKKNIEETQNIKIKDEKKEDNGNINMDETNKIDINEININNQKENDFNFKGNNFLNKFNKEQNKGFEFTNNYYMDNMNNKINFNNPIFNNNNNAFNNNYNNYFYGNNYFNDNYNNSNSYSQMDYYMNNNQNYYNQNNMNSMMNQSLNLGKNNNMIKNNNFNYQMNQKYNQNNIDNLNSNFPKYNQFLQSSGNINIQNNYFMYNNQENLKNNQNSQNINNIQVNNINENKTKEQKVNEKPKKKRRKKQKRLDSSSYINKPISYLAENFCTMAKDQGASRYLQKMLDSNPKEIIDAVFIPLCKNALKLINDPFGNYLIQKLITYFNQDQLLKILSIISPSFYEISCNSHGTRVLQKMIGLLSSPVIKNYFFDLVKPIVTPLLKDLNGTYIVQKFATQNINDYGLRINAIIIENSSELCTHRHGCCVIQKYLETRDQTMIPALIDKLIEDSLLLIIDQFGNYVIQTILLMGDKKYGNILAEKICPNIVFYAKHKYSSNVVEKCFDYCDGIYLKNLMSNVQRKENLIKLMLDEHGNYVVQKVLSLSPSKKQKAMLAIIKTLFDKLKNLPYGERVINRIVTTYPYINNC